MTASNARSVRANGAAWKRYVPALTWLPAYRRQDLSGDLLAGVIVAIMLVPQGMAYALLAGLPPKVGLYASIAPLIIYGLLGTSRALAVGPVAIVSLLVATGVSPLAAAGSADYLQLALTLALMVGVIQTLMGFLRIGFLVNFLSHPVLGGFTSAAAIVIGFSQVKHLFGIRMPDADFFTSVRYAATHLEETNPATLAIGAGGVALLLYFKYGLAAHLRRLGLPAGWITPLTKSAPLVVVLLGTLLVWAFQLDARAGVRIVGAVPAGLPPLTLPILAPDMLLLLLPTALVISFVGYMESISVAKSLASKRRQKVDSNQELVALGAANLGAAFTGGYPVTGGFSRSVVNYTAGANTGLASLITAVLIAITVIFLTPLFYFLPNAILAAIIIVAVSGLVDVAALRHIWRYSRADALSYVVTFAAVLAAGIEMGIIIGVGAAILLFIWRTSKPHVAIVGRLGQSETYRNVLRHQVQTWPELVAVRVDESLYFPNTKYLEDTLLSLAADRPEVTTIVLIGTAVNFIDASALETLESLHHELGEAGIALHFAAIKGPVMDRLRRSGFVEQVGVDHFHESTHQALCRLGFVGERAAEA